jgi:SNF2 family DNA or RNA helicase
LIIRSGRIYAYIPFEQKDRARDIAGYQWHDEIKKWSWPLSAKARVICVFPHLEKTIAEEEQKYRKSVKDLHEAKKRALKNLELDVAIYKRKPHERQLKMIKRMILNKTFGLLSGCGTGKSQAIINTYDTLHRDGMVKRCLIVCPKTVMKNWQAEVEINSDYSSVLIDGTKAQREKLISTNKNFYIINYDGLLVLKKYEWWDKFDMVALDESSKIKNLKALRTKFILKNLSGAVYKYILSGTSITQSPLDAYSQSKFLNPAIFSHRSFADFRRYYCILEEHTNHRTGKSYYEVKGYQNLEDMKKRLKYHSAQFSIDDCADLPPKIYTKRILDMSKELRDQYNEMLADFKTFSTTETLSANKIITQMLRLHQILSGAYLKDQKNNIKLDALDQILDETLVNGNKVIVWCRYIKSIELIKDLLRKKEIKFSELHGQVSDRQGEIDKFQDGPSQVMVGQVETGGMGINLTAGNVVVYYENTFSLEDRIQSEARSYRIGQGRKVLYFDLIYNKTIDFTILQAIKSKQDIAKYLVKSFSPGDYNDKKNVDQNCA